MAILFLLLFGPEKLPTVIVEGMRMFRQLRAAAEEATGEIRREFEAAASEIEAAKKELTSAVDEVQRFGAETRALVDEAQREAATGGTAAAAAAGEGVAGSASSNEAASAVGGPDDAASADAAADDPMPPTDIGSILPPDMAAMMQVHDEVDPAEHAIEAMGGHGRSRESQRDPAPAATDPAPEVDA